MKHLVLPLLLTSLAITTVFSQQVKQDGTDDVTPGRVLVKLDPSAASNGFDARLRGILSQLVHVDSVVPWLNPKLVAYGSSLYRQRRGSDDPTLGLLRIFAVCYSGTTSPRELAARLSRQPGVEYAEPVYKRELLYQPNDPSLSSQWYLNRIQAFDAWDVQRGDTSMIIGIVDAGIEIDHPDVAPALWHNPGETGGGKETNGIDDDGNGFIDDTWGWDFAGFDGRTPDNYPDNRAENHGTLSAGCAAAVGDNGIGVAGVAFGCRLMAVKITTDQHSPPLFNEPEGILYAAKMGCRVINCSFGGTTRSRAEEEVVRVVIDQYDAVVVAACGNNGNDERYYPASYGGVISVAATSETDNKSSFSDYNYRVDLSAPGDNILSTGSGGYVYDAGTSFAAPQVSGAAALVRLKWPGLDAASVAEVLRASSDDNRGSLPSAYADKMGAGRLNVGSAITVGTAIRSARVVAWDVVDGNGNGVVEPGEAVRLRVQLKNVLAPASSVTVVAAPVDPVSVVFNRATVVFDAMATGETRITGDTAFNFTVPQSIGVDGQILVRLTIVTPDRTSDQFITIAVSPSWQTTDNNDLAVTFNSVGNVGFNGIDRSQGEGFLYRGGDNVLYHAGLMIGLDETHLADVVRVGSTSMGVSDGLRTTELYKLGFSQDSTVETGEALFNDDHLPVSSRVGIHVRMRTFQYRSADARNFVIIRYRIDNATPAPLNNLRCGLYLDWDVSTDGLYDKVDYDGARALGMAHDTTGGNGIWVGAMHLSGGETSFYAVNNFVDGVLSDFSPARKWQTLSSGIVTNDVVDDMGMTMGRSGIDIPPGGFAEVGFALLAAESYDSLVAAADKARLFYLQSGVQDQATGSPVATCRPNPARERVMIAAVQTRAGRITAEFFGSDGRLVHAIDAKYQPAGTSRFVVDLRELPVGPLFCRVTTADGTSTIPVAHVAR